MQMTIRTMNIEDYDKVYTLWMSCKNMGFNNLDACVIIGLNQRKPYKSRVAGLSPIILDRKIGTLTLPDDYLCSAA